MSIYRISNRQVFSFFIIIIASLSFGLPNLLMRTLKQDFWETIVVALIVEVLLGWVLFQLGLRYPKKTIFQYSEIILGKFLGKLFTFLLVLFFTNLSTGFLSAIVEFFTIAIMPETPAYVFKVLLLLVSIYAINAGIEVIMRVAEIWAPIVIASYLAIIFLNLKWMELDNLKPMFQHGVLEILQASMLPVAWFGICIIMGVFMAYHNNPKDCFKMKMGGMGVGVIILTTTMLAGITAFGMQVILKQVYSIFLLSQMVSVGDFIERMESIQVVTWLAGGFICICSFHYAGSEGLRQIFQAKSLKIIAPIVAVGIYVASEILFPTSVNRTEFMKNTFPYFAMGIEIVGICSLYAVSLIKDMLNPKHRRMN